MKQSEIDEAIAFQERAREHERRCGVPESLMQTDRAILALRALKPDPEPQETCETLAEWVSKLTLGGREKQQKVEAILRRLHGWMENKRDETMMFDLRAILRGDRRV